LPGFSPLANAAEIGTDDTMLIDQAGVIACQPPTAGKKQ